MDIIYPESHDVVLKYSNCSDRSWIVDVAIISEPWYEFRTDDIIKNKNSDRLSDVRYTSQDTDIQKCLRCELNKERIAFLGSRIKDICIGCDVDLFSKGISEWKPVINDMDERCTECIFTKKYNNYTMCDKCFIIRSGKKKCFTCGRLIENKYTYCYNCKYK